MRNMWIFCALALFALAAADISDGGDASKVADAFKANREYQFKYDAQTSSGYVAVPDQCAMNRIQATIRITFTTDTEATLKLRRVRIAQHNGVAPGDTSTRFLPMRAFTNRILPRRNAQNSNDESAIDEYENQLHLPVKFTLQNNGRLDSLRFSKADSAASRNLKKSIMNMLQFRLKSQRDVNGIYGDEKRFPAYEHESISQRAQNDQREFETVASAWTDMETTLEGKCAVMYTVWRTDRQSTYDDFDFQSKNFQQKVGHFNVTKSIDFSRCTKTADVLYGYHMTPKALEDALCEAHDATDRSAEDRSNDEQNNNSNGKNKRGCGGALTVPREALQRSTVFRYTIRGQKHLDSKNRPRVDSGANHYGIQKVHLMSDYRYYNGDESKTIRNSMHTVAIAELAFEKSVPAVTSYENFRGQGEQNNETGKENNGTAASKYGRWNNVDESEIETLLYNADFESREKRFYARGDKITNELDGDESIAKVFLQDALVADELTSNEKKSARSMQLMARAETALDAVAGSFVENQDEGAEGINGPFVGEKMKTLVSLLRMFTLKGLKQLQTRAFAAEKRSKFGAAAHDVFIDALSICGTRNAFVLLADAVGNEGENANNRRDTDGGKDVKLDALKSAKVMHALGANGALFAPSDELADVLLSACKALRARADIEPAASYARDACWLTFANLVGQLDALTKRAENGAQNSPTNEFDKVASHKMDLYREVLMNMLKDAKTTLEKILALKRLGNAGLESTVKAILAIVKNVKEPQDVRLHAIDALRRVIVPRSVDSASAARAAWKAMTGLLPIFGNEHERADVRMAAALAIMHGVNDAPSGASNALLCTSSNTKQENRGPEKQSCVRPSLKAFGDQSLIISNNADILQFISDIAEMMRNSPIKNQKKSIEHVYKALKGKKSFGSALKDSLTRRSHVSRMCFSMESGTDASSNCNDADMFLTRSAIYASSNGNNDNEDGYDMPPYPNWSMSDSDADLSPLPSQTSLEWDAYVGGEYQRNKLSIGFVQRNLESVIRALLAKLRTRFAPNSSGANDKNFSSGKKQQNNDNLKKENQPEQSFLSRAFEGIKKIVTGKKESDVAPYAVLSLRHNDVDVFVLPITDQNVASLMAILQGSDASIVSRIRQMISGADGSDEDSMIRAAIAFNTQMARIPTSVGLPLKIESATMAFGALDFAARSTGSSSLRVSSQPNLAVVQVVAMRAWAASGSAGVSAGVASTYVAELNAPFKAELTCADGQPKCELNIPLSEKNVRLLGYHSVPITIIASPNSNTNRILSSISESSSADAVQLLLLLSADASDAMAGSSFSPMSVENARTLAQQNEIDHTWLADARRFSLPVRIYGHYIAPCSPRVNAIADALAASSLTDLHVDFEPRAGETARAIKVTIGGTLFERDSDGQGKSTPKRKNSPSFTSVSSGSSASAWSRIREGLDAFYASFDGVLFGKNKPNKYEKMDSDDQSNSEESNEQPMKQSDSTNKYNNKKNVEQGGQSKNFANAHENTHRYLNDWLEQDIPYRHTISVVVENVGAQTPAKAEAELRTVCDAQMRACEVHTEMTCRRMHSREQQPWSANARIQIIYPEMVSNAAELDPTSAEDANEARHHAKLFLQMKADWGARNNADDKRQNIIINILGEPSEQNIYQALEADAMNAQKASKKPITHEWNNAVPFIDTYTAVAKYQLQPRTEIFVRDAIGALKSAYFWQSNSQLNLADDSRKTNTVMAVLRMNADAPAYANLSLWTPMERIFIRSMETPAFVPIVPLVPPSTARAVRVSAAVDAEQREVERMFTRYLPKPVAHVFHVVNDIEHHEAGNHMCQIAATNDSPRQITVRSFEDAKYTTTLSEKCYTIMAMSCRVPQSRRVNESFFNLAIKNFANGQTQKQKSISLWWNEKNNTQKKTVQIVIEPIAAGDWQMAVIINGDRFTRATASRALLAQLVLRYGIWFTTSAKRQIVYMHRPGMFKFYFDGVEAIIKMDAKSNYSNVQGCGLCGQKKKNATKLPGTMNYESISEEDSSSTEFIFNTRHLISERVSDAERTDRCDAKIVLDTADYFHSAKRDWNDKRKIKKQQQQQKQQQKQHKSNEWNSIKDEEPKSINEPINATLVVEYNHRVCFSRSPVRQCSVGSYATDASGERDFVNRVKVPVVCLPRESIEARRLRAQVRARGIADANALDEYPISYSELVAQPEKCMQY